MSVQALFLLFSLAVSFLQGRLQCRGSTLLPRLPTLAPIYREVGGLSDHAVLRTWVRLLVR